MKGRLVSRRLRSQDELGCGAGRNRPVWRLQAGLGCAHMTRGDILSTEVSRAAHPGPGARTGPGAAETPDRDKRQPPRLERGERGPGPGDGDRRGAGHLEPPWHTQGHVRGKWGL